MLFTRKTGFTTLDNALCRIYANKSELLLVLERPDIPLHNNLSKRDIREYVMPKMTGDRLGSELIAVRPDIPIIICTGFSDRMNPDQANAIGIKGFLMKPVVKTELAAFVRKVLDETKGVTQP